MNKKRKYNTNELTNKTHFKPLIIKRERILICPHCKYEFVDNALKYGDKTFCNKCFGRIKLEN